MGDVCTRLNPHLAGCLASRGKDDEDDEGDGARRPVPIVPPARRRKAVHDYETYEGLYERGIPVPAPAPLGYEAPHSAPYPWYPDDWPELPPVPAIPRPRPGRSPVPTGSYRIPYVGGRGGFHRPLLRFEPRIKPQRYRGRRRSGQVVLGHSGYGGLPYI